MKSEEKINKKKDKEKKKKKKKKRENDGLKWTRTILLRIIMNGLK